MKYYVHVAVNSKNSSLQFICHCCNISNIIETYREILRNIEYVEKTERICVIT